MKKIILLALGLMANVALAMPLTSDITIPTISLPAKSSAKVNLSELTNSVSYSVSCLIQTNTNSEVDVFVKGGWMMTLDGVTLSPQSVLRLKNHYADGYELKITGLYKETELEFKNLDDTAYVSFTNCAAKVE